jgi:hypothetical protein
MEEPLDDSSPLHPPKLKKMSRELVGIETLLGEAWKPLPEGSRLNPAGKLSQSAQFALEDEEFEDMRPMCAAATIITNHDHEDGIDNPNSYTVVTQSPLAETWDTAMKALLDAIGQHQVFGDFVELPEEGKALPCHWEYKIKRDGAGNVQLFKARLDCGGNHQIEGIDYQSRCALSGRLGHVRLALPSSTKYNLGIRQMDVCTDSMGVGLEEEIYMGLPQGYFCLLRTG